MELLTDYDCKIKYHRGKANVVVDALSRKERSERLMMIATRVEVTSTLLDEIKRFQAEALKPENLKAERMVSLKESLIEDSRGLKCYNGRIWIPMDEQDVWGPEIRILVAEYEERRSILRGIMSDLPAGKSGTSTTVREAPTVRHPCLEMGTDYNGFCD
ncbi:hypothetical protein L6452_38628 [Arctium lappa]|uniref:Uncharacterized protein n=1 Tax=Arctium lappa TaxID=4217 RepID=A0ACB8XQ26_ARCLA|nr:hypothetical protein L6452_38628 [Arctium lappa]